MAAIVQTKDLSRQDNGSQGSATLIYQDLADAGNDRLFE